MQVILFCADATVLRIPEVLELVAVIWGAEAERKRSPQRGRQPATDCSGEAKWAWRLQLQNEGENPLGVAAIEDFIFFAYFIENSLLASSTVKIIQFWLLLTIQNDYFKYMLELRDHQVQVSARFKGYLYNAKLRHINFHFQEFMEST